MTEKKFKELYMGDFIDLNTTPKTVCGECIFFDNGCTTSQIERKYGNYNTPSCSEFVARSEDE